MSTQLQTLLSGYSENCKDGVLIPATGKQINFYSARATNQSGGAIDVGICFKQALSAWKLYTITAANTPTGLDYTAAIQAGGAVNIFDTTANDGFMVGCSTQFNVLGLTISTAQAGSPIYVYQYWNGASWQTLTTQAKPSSYSAADQLIVFAAPQDWAQGCDTASGALTNYFYIRVRATTASSQAVQADAAWVCTFIEFQPQVASDGFLEFTLPSSDYPLVLSGTQSILPYFGGSANAANMIRILYSIQS